MHNIQIGMSSTNIQQIMGEPQEIILGDSTVFYYKYPTMNIKFHNDKVVVIEHKRSSYATLQTHPPTPDEINTHQNFNSKSETAKRLLFLFTFIITVHFVFLALSNNGIWFFGLFPWNLLFPVGLIEIPSILFHQPTQDRFYLISSPIGIIIAFWGWVMYFCIAIVGIKTQKRFLFVVVYILFILLLLGNISGCVNQTHFFPKVPGL